MQRDFIHPDLLRCINFGNNQEAAGKFFARIERETEEVEELRKRGFSASEAWLLTRVQRVVN